MTRRTRVLIRLLTLLLLLEGSAAVLYPSHVSANVTIPPSQLYSGYLVDAHRKPITSSITARFSYWKSADNVAGDTTGGGAINTLAANYAGWTEEMSFTPDATGYFSLELGSVVPLPDLTTLSTSDLLHLFIQVELKNASSPDTSYELIDPFPTDATHDRSQVSSVPFANNADLLDQRDTGTGSTDIPVLGISGLLPISTVPGGTNRDFFTIDADDTASSPSLTFGTALGKILSYDTVNQRFNFNDTLRVQGNLIVTGLINGVDVSTLSPLRVSSGAGLAVTVVAGNYRLNGNLVSFSGTSSTLSNNATNYLFFTETGFIINTSGFPGNRSFIPLATALTSGGAITSITDKRVAQSDNRENTIKAMYHPDYPDSSYQGDGTNNVGQLSVTHDNTAKSNFYLWTSTRSTLQDYDIILRVTLSPHFVRWKNATPLTVNYRSTTADTADNALDITVFDTNGQPVTLTGMATGLANTSWSSTSLGFSGTPTWTAGQTLVIHLKASARSTFQIHMADIELQWVDKEGE